MTKRIHYFNPGHETAVLNGSPFYRPPLPVLKMQEDLSLLPVWYADPDDYVLLSNGTFVPVENVCAKNIYHPAPDQYPVEHSQDMGSPEEVEFWGISPQSVRFFEKLNKQQGLQLKIPEWKEEYRLLGSRFSAREVLARLIESIPEIEKTILPQFFSEINAIENYVLQSVDKQLVKSPFSSSGRGLVWLPPEKLACSERQIIRGMLKKQSQVSIEKALDKQLDFSMHFEINNAEETRFIGYSLFQTNAKGAYERSILAGQSVIEQQITKFVDKKILQKVQETLTDILHELYSPHYKGNIGVDMLIYRSEDQYRLNPCVEINMRKSMGYLAIRLFENYIHPDSTGEFRIEYHPDPKTLCEKHSEWQNRYPLVYEDKRIKSGYLSLCPVTETSNYHAFAVVF